MAGLTEKYRPTRGSSYGIQEHFPPLSQPKNGIPLLICNNPIDLSNLNEKIYDIREIGNSDSLTDVYLIRQKF